MAGEGVHDNPNLKGFARYFNSETNVGRANVSRKYLLYIFNRCATTTIHQLKSTVFI